MTEVNVALLTLLQPKIFLPDVLVGAFLVILLHVCLLILLVDKNIPPPSPNKSQNENVSLRNPKVESGRIDRTQTNQCTNPNREGGKMANTNLLMRMTIAVRRHLRHGRHFGFLC